MTARMADAADFLRQIGWADAGWHQLAGDASDRSYARLTRQGQSAILMDSPIGQADDPHDFVKIANHLRDIGLSAPRIYEADLDRGFLLIEDFGDGVFARIIAQDPTQETALYLAAADVLVHLGSHPPAKDLPNLSVSDWAEAAALCFDCYCTDQSADLRGDFVAAMQAALSAWADGPRVMILRDYHAENLMLLPDRTGVRQVGLLDFQLGQMGQAGYDLVSLFQDARRDVSQDLASELIKRYAHVTGQGDADFGASLAVLGAQRAFRILGVFARLAKDKGKIGYLSLMPRVWEQLWRNLGHPALADLVPISRHLPEPAPVLLQRIVDGR